MLIYIGPALMTLQLREKRSDGAGSGDSIAATLDATTGGLWAVIAIGVALAIVGTADSVTQMLAHKP